MKSKIQFVDKKIKKNLEKLKIENPDMYKFILRAFEDIEKNVFCGVQIPKKLIPKEYIKKVGVRNVWKYNLPDAWRLMYSIENNQINVLSIILEWLDHKEYERRFKY